MQIPNGIIIYKDSFPLLHVSVVYCSKYHFPVILFFPVFYYFFMKYSRCFFSSVLLFLQNFFKEGSHMTQSVSEHISYFRTMLLETARIPSWHYSAAFSLIESSCSWEMELKNFFLLESGALLKQIQENCSQSRRFSSLRTFHGLMALIYWSSADVPMWKMEIFFIPLLRMIFSARTQAPMYLELCVPAILCVRLKMS